MVQPRVGSPWNEEMREFRAGVIRDRALEAAERASRPSVADWYAGRSVLLTGASGFLGRVLVEFLLRCCPEVARVFVVLRARKGMSAQDRLPQLFDVPLFDRLRSEQPSALSKVVALPGNVEALALGLSEEDRRRVLAEVSVVFHMAASVRFDDPFRKAVFTNLRSAREVVLLAKEMPQLKALVHVSTAYCYINQSLIEERVYPNALDWRDVLRWAEELSDQDLQAVDFLGDKVRGFQPNTYTFTKALAERLMEDAADELPVVITRPSIVMNSLSDPIPGWMDNLNGLCGFWAGTFKGVLRVVHCKRVVVMDTVPVDICSKLILLASWTKGLGLQLNDSGVDVVNTTVGPMLGLSFDEFQFATDDEFIRKNIPYPGALRVQHFRCEPCPFKYAFIVFYEHILFGAVMDLLARLAGVKPRLLGIYRRISTALAATARFRVEVQFDMHNQRRLQIMTHPQDEKNLDYLDLYLARDGLEPYVQVAINNLRGVLVYVLREEDNVEKNLRNLNRVKWLGRAYHTVMALLALAVCSGLYCLLRRSTAADQEAALISTVK